MTLFNTERKIKKYTTVFEILDEFYIIRMDTYKERKVRKILKLELHT